MMKSTYVKYENLPGDNSWCLQTKTIEPNSILFVRPCNSTEAKQKWYFNATSSQIGIEDSVFCIQHSAKRLFLADCKDVVNPFTIDNAQNAIYVTNTFGKDLYFGVDNIKIFSRVRLFKESVRNSSWNTWKRMYEGPSEGPSALPSARPSTSIAPSSMPSVSKRHLIVSIDCETVQCTLSHHSQ